MNRSHSRNSWLIREAIRPLIDRTQSHMDYLNGFPFSVSQQIFPTTVPSSVQLRCKKRVDPTRFQAIAKFSLDVMTQSSLHFKTKTVSFFTKE